MATAAKPKTNLPQRGTRLTVGFGLVSVPMAIKPLTESTRTIGATLTCPEHGPGIKQKYVCQEGTPDQHLMSVGETAKAYGPELVVLDPSDVKALDESRTGSAQIERIVDVHDVDPVYFDRSYMAYPQTGGEQAFDLLAEILRTEGKAAVITTVLTKQQQTFLMRWSDELGCMLVHSIHYTERIRHGEVRLVTEAAAGRAAIEPQMVEAARPLLAVLEGEFDPTEVADDYTPQLEALIAASAAGRPFVPPKVEEPPKPADDLMATLLASVPQAKPKTKARAKTRAKKEVASR